MLWLGFPCVAPIARAQASVEPAPQGDARVEANDRGGVASVEILGCLVSLECHSDSTSLDYANRCPQSTAEKAKVLDTLLGALFGEAGVPSSVTVLRTGWMKGYLRGTLPAHRVARECVRGMEGRAREAKRDGPR